MYREFIDEFVLSPSMREYLKTVDLSVEQITQLIYFSPVLLQQKNKHFTDCGIWQRKIRMKF